jgi:hypothetical protein
VLREGTANFARLLSREHIALEEACLLTPRRARRIGALEVESDGPRDDGAAAPRAPARRGGRAGATAPPTTGR